MKCQMIVILIVTFDNSSDQDLSYPPQQIKSAKTSIKDMARCFMKKFGST